MTVSIRPVKNEQAESVIQLILNIQQNEFNVPITLEGQPDLLQIESFYYGSGGGFWGAFMEEQLVGTIALIKFDNHAGAIRKMFVKKEFRGKETGVAQQLLDCLLNYAAGLGLNHLYLGTITKLAAALRFYEKNNFVQIPKSALPGGFPLMLPDNVFCHLALNPEK